MSKNLVSLLSLKFRIRNLLLSSIIETYLFLQVIYIFFNKYTYLDKQIFYNNLISEFSGIYFIFLYFLIKLIKFKILKYYIYIIFEELTILIIFLLSMLIFKQNFNLILIFFLSYIIARVIYFFCYFIISKYFKIKEEVIHINCTKKDKHNKMINVNYISNLEILSNHLIKTLSKKKINYIIVNNSSAHKKIDLNKLQHFTVFIKNNNDTYLKDEFFKNHLSNYTLINKRIIDIVISLSAILVLLPLLIIISIIIKIDSKGPIFFIQKRHGYRKKIFNIIKFRTMFDADRDLHSTKQTKINDSRITKFGKFIRKTNIDELPNLLNVLFGQMSIVGPRPHALKTKLNNNFYIHNLENYNYRFLTKPGITSLSHVRSSAGQLSTMSKLKARINFDLIYVKKCSVIFDMRIILMTLKLYI